MKATFCAAVAMLACTGCALMQSNWVKPGGSSEELQRTVAKCKANAGFLPLQTGLLAAARHEQYMENCLMAEGWVKE